MMVPVIPGLVTVVVEIGALVLDTPPPVPVPDPPPVTPATLEEAPVEIGMVGNDGPVDAPVGNEEMPLGLPEVPVGLSEPPVTALPWM